MSFRSCHCCQEPGRVFVWIVSAMTVTKVVEGCVYIRRHYYAILPRVGGEFEHSALSLISLALSSNATTLNHLIRLRGSQGIQIWKQRTSYTTYLGSRLIPGTKYIRIWHITYVRIDFCRLIPGTAAAFQAFWLVICSNSNKEQTFHRDRP